ncbi:O(6)-methylguanine-induced apoptosis 2 [Acipenser ruthenus]|uniref:O(6)-methylguanine-induced apoptosis 2 n=1 Tax=Acipenser ruthenus TaxID=7906 RepID=A0A444UWI8_ACIRT|nr:O(6)-methylguanine-induced apoptosis 2 [Acipenser ruthenus]
MADALDSVAYSDFNHRRIHSNAGKLCRGFRFKTKISSIPSKYQTVVTCNTERKGFTSQTKRFLYETNQAARQPQNAIQKTPAANAYRIKSSLMSQKNSYGNSSMFKKPIAVNVEKLKKSTPAPNQYDVSKGNVGMNNSVAAQSAFLSETKREHIPRRNLKVPSPCHYNVNYSLIEISPKVAVSCFKSTTMRGRAADQALNPGPGAYNPYEVPEPVKKIIFPKRHYLSISAPPMQIPKMPPPPGPGQYEIVDYFGPPKHYMSSAVFVSNTSRWTGDTHGKGLPGPGYYEPEKPTKQSFLYNFCNKWVPP